ncbi:DUF3788 family protein [Breznakiella homolactica]|uniref:DUF3788 family protein n=1 Tax=Breznakiella homolactica TaxID=2798577 RepID=A0A7T7XMW5_9SPIR|nr:DUF3788 family protein [Breznakiella homolactica]QQO09157.1 DUF3788 domain-containing protein [Breznakiella homolactica]
MAKSMYRDKSLQPDREILVKNMGSGITLWDKTIAMAETLVPGIGQEWKFYGKPWGWSLVLQEKKKNILYITPAETGIQLSFIFSEKGRELSKTEDIPEEIQYKIEESKNNPQGHTFDFDIRKEKDLALAEKLLKIKLAT